MNGKHLIINGLIPHWLRPFTPIDDGARYAVVEFRFATNCPPAELETEVAKRDPTTDRRGGVLKQLLRYAGRTFVNDTSHLELKQVAKSVIRQEIVEVAARSHQSVAYFLNGYWRRVCSDIA